MARMIPSVIDTDTESPAERMLFSLFRDRLPANCTVFHSVRWLKQKKNRTFDGEHEIPDPIKQAEDSMHEIRRLLMKSGIPAAEQITRSYAVAFPDMLRGQVPELPALPPAILLTREDLDRIEPAIERVYDFHRQSGKAKELTRSQLDKVMSIIAPSFASVWSLAERVEHEAERLIALTEEQHDVLEILAEKRRARIIGCAGSGKTVLAVEKARRLSRERAHVLYGCFNLFLGEYVRQELSRGPESVEAFSFETLCREMAARAGLPWNKPTDEKAIPRFFDVEAPELLLEAAERVGPMYDAIVVDEGQDFPTDYFPPIEELLRGGGNGVLYVFADPMQDFWKRNPVYPAGLEEPFILPHNCRNTAAISRFLARLMGAEIRTRRGAPQGEEPRFVSCASRDEQRAKVLEILDELCGKGGLTPDQIVILPCRSAERSVLGGESSLGRHLLCHDAFPPPPGRILVTSALRYKGLEADAAIITDLDLDPKMRSLDVLYVGASRARHRLYLLGAPDAISLFEAMR